MGDYNSTLPHCESQTYDENYGDLCYQCETGYGLGGSCKKNACKSCIKCGQNCNSCKKCVCTECFIGYTNNPNDPSNCIVGDYGYQDLSFKKYECDSNFIKTNYFFILFILLLIKFRH